MKTALPLLACLGLWFSTAAAEETMSVTQGRLVKVVAVHAGVRTEAGMKTTMQVIAVGEFVNSCEAPSDEKELIASARLASDNVTYDVHLVHMDHGRPCPKIYQPVQRNIAVANLVVAEGRPAPIVLPIFFVNGVKVSPVRDPH